MRDLLREVMGEEESFFATAVQGEGTHLVDPRAFSDPQALEDALVLAMRKLLQP
jgi:hypothetical protein